MNAGVLTEKNKKKHFLKSISVVAANVLQPSGYEDKMYLASTLVKRRMPELPGDSLKFFISASIMFVFCFSYDHETIIQTKN